MPLTQEDLQEYTKELTQLADEWKLGKDTTKQVTAREKDIRTRILSIANKLDATHRVVMPIPEIDMQWDRVLAKKAGTGDVSLDQLERVLGEKKFKTLCTSRTTTHNFDMGKYLAARESGEITDDMIAACTVPVQYEPRLTLNKMAAVVEEVDEEDVN